MNKDFILTLAVWRVYMDKMDLINQLSKEIHLTEESKEKEEEQYISATGTLETNPEKSLENLKPVEKKEDDLWSHLKLDNKDLR